ncbi:hypothetical protein [Kineococcus sp. SYSU DK003]|uniref:hypothetical protein n=1 Tax=Kineococcus sp. SYSU DK003 TaxID=3383124 RepID=UPI003D7DB271
MPASSLIFLVIIALTAAHLVPNAIRKHRRTASARQADRDSEAMRVVVRRNSAPVGNALAAAAVNAAALGSSSRPVLGAGPKTVSADTPSPKVTLKPLRSGTSRVVARRRRLLATAAGLTVVGWGLVAAGVAPWWSGVVPTLGLALVLGALSRHGAAAPARVAAPAVASTVVISAQRPVRRAATIPAPRVDRPAAAVPEQGWEPVAVPLPTYLLKDKARTWELPPPAAERVEVVEDDEPTQVIDLREHARVVNG